MSGIAGIIRFDGAPVERGKIEKMTDAMSFRGPDGINHWTDGSVALGHCMLRTTPESLGETQPLANESATVVMVMDGRIDNREDLLGKLLAKGARLRTQTDVELVLRAYELWGKECPRHLLGDFAFVVWDGLRNELFCARDHFGVKPFYYFKSPRFLAISSEEEGFFGLPEVPREANEDRIAGVFVGAFDGIDFDNSCLKSIVKLPAGTSMSVKTTGQVILHTYWQLEPQDESRFASDAECEEAFRSVLRESVRCRMRSLGNPALMLSGGIDSAAIAGAARTLLDEMPGKDLATFSVVAEDGTVCAETSNIKAIINDYERHAHVLKVPSFQGGTSDQDLMEAAWTNAHPVNNSILLPAMMYLSASRAGHRVMFDGIDGDLATYSPELYLAHMMRAGQWREAWAESHHAGVHHTYLRHRSPLAVFLINVWSAAAPQRLKAIKNSVMRLARPTIPIGSSLISAEFADKIHLTQRLTKWNEDALGHRPLNHQERQIRALLPIGVPRGMEGYDRVAARYGIEPRHPWVDRRLIDFYVRLPLRFKVREGWTKFLVRSATAPWLTNEVRWHKEKRHLGWHFAHRLMMHNRKLASATLRAAAVDTLKDFVEPARLRALLATYESGARDAEVQQLFDVLSVALWLQRLRHGPRDAWTRDQGLCSR